MCVLLSSYLNKLKFRRCIILIIDCICKFMINVCLKNCSLYILKLAISLLIIQIIQIFENKNNSYSTMPYYCQLAKRFTVGKCMCKYVQVLYKEAKC